MRKIIRFFLNYVLVSATIINISACKWGCTSGYDLADENQRDISGNYLVPDMNKRTKQVISDRLNGRYEDVASLKTWYLQSPKNRFNKTSKKLEFINNLEEKIKYKARQESINDFNVLANNNTNFRNFSDLQNQLNNTNLGKINVNINWDSLINSLPISNDDKNEIKNKLVRFYNIFAQVYRKENILKLLYRMSETHEDDSLGFIKYQYSWDSKFDNYSVVQVMAINPISLDFKIQKRQYLAGAKASKSIIRTVVHEYGHALGTFIRLNAQQKQNINSLADADPDEWWNNYFKSSFLLKNNIEKVKINDETNYMISLLANETKINDATYQKILAFAIVRSEYGRDSHPDLFAEAFDQWIDTEEDQRNLAWEKLDKFFRIDLLKVL